MKTLQIPSLMVLALLAGALGCNRDNDQAQRSVIEARFNLLNARVDLEERIGGPLVPNN